MSVCKHNQEVIEKLRDMIEDQKLTQKKAAEILGVHLGTVEKWCSMFGLKTQRSGPRSGKGHPGWKGGRYLSGRYWYVYSPEHPNRTKHGYVAEHRLAMEKKLGRFLDHKEVVHHIDGNPGNNYLDNLIVFQTNADHLKSELTGKVPKWTPEGWKKIIAPRRETLDDEYHEKMRLRARQWHNRRRLLRLGDDLQLQ